jgi:hypothetical protein
MAYITTGGSVPNDLPQGTTHSSIGHTEAFVVQTGTDIDGTIESGTPPVQFLFASPTTDLPVVNFLTETAYAEIWNLMGISTWDNFNKNWNEI